MNLQITFILFCHIHRCAYHFKECFPISCCKIISKIITLELILSPHGGFCDKSSISHITRSGECFDNSCSISIKLAFATETSSQFSLSLYNSFKIKGYFVPHPFLTITCVCLSTFFHKLFLGCFLSFVAHNQQIV